MEFLDETNNLLQSIPTEIILRSSLDGSLDPMDNMYKASSKSVVAMTTELLEFLPTTKKIVIKAHLQTNASLMQPTPVAIPSNASLYFESFLKLTTKNTLK